MSSQISRIRAAVACWPISARLSYGKVANRLQDDYKMGWVEAETRAYQAVLAKLAALRKANPTADLGFRKVVETKDPYLPDPDDLPLEPGGYGRGPYLYDNDAYQAAIEYDRVHSSLLTAPKEPKKHKGFSPPAVIAGPAESEPPKPKTVAVELPKTHGTVGIYDEAKAVTAKRKKSRKKHSKENSTFFEV